MIRRAAMATSLCAVLVGAAACGGTGTTSSPSRPTSISVVLGAVADPYWHQSMCGAKAEGKRLGVRVDWQGPAGVDIPAELQTLNAVIQKRPSAIVLVP